MTDNFEGITLLHPSFTSPKLRSRTTSLNVFGWDKRVIIHYLRKFPEDLLGINLMLIKKTGKFHYTWIKDSLLYDQSDGGVNISASAVLRAIRGKTCWKVTRQSSLGWGRRR